MRTPDTTTAEPVFRHVAADFTGVPYSQLTDAPLLSGLLIASAGAAGFSAIGAPIVHQLPNDGVAGVLLLDGCHVTVHTFPERALLLLDILSLATHDPRKALDVFTRRLTARAVHSEVRDRGGAPAAKR
ncbi:MAG TPA: S-adenosylmethionine decarboxylase [Gemmatimonadaceae bacterium]|nr:S-adenosylmethionine decarboxylase [Gemmatimonadaceae bacterium]